MVALVICCCVNAMEVMMETARSVEEEWHEVNVAYEAKVSLRLSPRRIVGSLLTLTALYTPVCANVDGYFCQGRQCQHGTT